MTPSKTTTLKPLVIYHANCADGFSAAWCFWKRYGTGVDFHPGKYGQPVPDLKDRPTIYLVDFSYTPEQLVPLIQPGQELVLLDRHLSAARDWLAWLQKTEAEHAVDRNAEGGITHLLAFNAGPNKNIHVQFDMNRSGATLAWDFNFLEQPRPLLLGHVEDRDLGRFALPNTEAIQANLFSHKYEFDVWDTLMASSKPDLTKLAAGGQAIVRKHHKDLGEMAEAAARRMWIGGQHVPVLNVPYMMASDGGHLLAEQERTARLRRMPAGTEPEMQARALSTVFAATYYDSADGRHFSLRSLDDGADVSQIAKSYGGGGHARASGFRVPRDHELAKA